MNIDKQRMDCQDQPNQVSYFDIDMHTDIRGIVLRYAIATSKKPTNTAFALMCTSKAWCAISKNLFDRDAEVLASFVRQIEGVVHFWFSKKSALIEFHKNTFFFYGWWIS